MKRLVSTFIVFFVFCFAINVNAQEYETKMLIPVDTSVSVNTENFKYNDFVYSSSVNEKGNSVINFSSIQNVSNEKLPVSINILLFDNGKKNIGFLTYCTDKDVSTDYAGFKLSAGQSSSFSINVVSKYFVEGYAPKDVKYFAVLDENKYCQIGGYDKYAGLTIEKIGNGSVSNVSENVFNTQLSSFLKNYALKIVLIVFFVIFIVIFAFGIVINSLHKKMYNEGTILSFIPIASSYISVKLAFGKTIAKYYIIGFFVSSLLAFFGISIFSVLVSLISLASFVIVVFKLITKKYDLFSGIEKNLLSTNDKIKGDFVTYSTKGDANKNGGNVDLIDTPQEEAIDLSYTDNMSLNPSSKVSENSDLSNLFSSNSTADVNSQPGVNNIELSNDNVSSVSNSQGSDLMADIFATNDSPNNGGVIENSIDKEVNVGANLTVDNINNTVPQTQDLMSSIFSDSSNSNGTVTNSNNSNEEGESDLSKFFK